MWELCISGQKSWECLRQNGKSINRVWGRAKAQTGSGHVSCFLFPDSVERFPELDSSPRIGLLAVTSGRVRYNGKSSDQSGHPSSSLLLVLCLWACGMVDQVGPLGALESVLEAWLHHLQAIQSWASGFSFLSLSSLAIKWSN